MLISHLADAPLYFVAVVVLVMVSVVLHELGHGFAALWQGDETPRLTGHITLNPMVHMGGISLILLAVVGIAFGAMPVDPRRFRSRYGHAYVAFAGPAVNLALILVFALMARLITLGDMEALTNLRFAGICMLGVYYNILLFLFNLVPIPPLDGYTVLRETSSWYRRVTANPFFHQYGFLLFFVLLLGPLGSVFFGIVSHGTATIANTFGISNNLLFDAIASLQGTG